MEVKNITISDDGLLKGVYMTNINNKVILKPIEVDELNYLYNYRGITNKLHSGYNLRIVKENSFVKCSIGKNIININNENDFEEIYSTNGLSEEIFILNELNNQIKNNMVKKVVKY